MQAIYCFILLNVFYVYVFMFMTMIFSQSKDYLRSSREKNLYARHIVKYDCI